MRENINIAIIGNGVAGTRAAQVIRKLSPKARLTIISEENAPFYYRPQLVDFLNGDIPQKKLLAKPLDFYTKNRIKLSKGKKVSLVFPDKNNILLSSGESITYDKLLIASGVKVDISRYGLNKTENVFTLKTLRDALRLKKGLPFFKEITVFGENLLSFEFLRLLADRSGLRIRYLIRKERLWPEFFDKRLSRLVEGLLRGNKIELVYKFEVSKIIKGNGNFILISKNGKKLMTTSIGIFEPIIPNLDFLKGVKIKTGRTGIFIDRDYRTSVKNIFAAGDVAVRKESDFVNSWQGAWRDGKNVGLSMLGKDIADKKDRIVSFRIFDKPYISIGYTISSSKKGYKEITSSEETDSYKKIILKDNRVEGAVFFGDIRNFTKIEELISKKTLLKEDELILLKKIFEFYKEEQEFYSYNLICPVCKAVLNYSDRSEIGQVTVCPICGAELRVSLTEVSLVKKLTVI